jgi:PKD repeat protein
MSFRWAAIASSLVAAAWLFAPTPVGVRTTSADTGDVGYEDFSYSGASAPTESKPESKLWFNDGIWWASLYDKATSTYRIHKLNTSTQTWVNTGILLDDRPSAKADVLWDGTKLYVASHIYSTTPASGYPARLYRYSYSSATKTYSLDPGFPATINNYRTETLVIDKDSTGKLWATWTQNNQVWVNRTTGDDLTWGTPFVPSVSGTSLKSDDISSIVAFRPGKIGLMWSKQTTTAAMYFAVHVDGASDTTWETSRTAVQGKGSSDDHINLKSVGADSAGHVYAAIKTSFTSSSQPLIMILVRDPTTGDWTSYVHSRVSENLTRPIVVIDDEHRVMHVFATETGGGQVYEKTTPLDSVSFGTGKGTIVMKDASSPDIDSTTSTKQNVNSTTGLVVLAGNYTTHRYWHAYESLSGAPPPPPAPVAGFSGAPRTGVAPLSVQFTDTSTNSPTSWSWSFGDGDSSTSQNPQHTYANVGTYDVSLTATNAGGSDTLTRTGYIVVSNSPPPAPVADFSATPTSGSAPLSVQFTDTSTNSPTTWSWSFGDGGSSTSQNPQHTYNAAGTYDVSLTATNAGGSDTKTKNGYVTVSGGSGGGTLTFLSAADAHVVSTSPTRNFGTDTLLRVRNGTSDGTVTYRPYLKFNVSGVSGTVSSVKLRLYVNTGTKDGGGVYPVGSGWTESGITWDTAPPISGSPLASYGVTTTGTWADLELGPGAVTGNGTYSFAVANSILTASGYYSSREGTDPPQLVVTFGP